MAELPKADGAEARARDVVRGFMRSAALGAAVSVGLFDALAAEPMSTEELALALGCDAGGLARLLRALASDGLCAGGVTYTLTDAGRALCSGTALHAELLHLLDPSCQAAWGALAGALRSGETAFPAVYGVDAWTWRAQHPGAGARFAAMAAAASRAGADALADALPEPDGGLVVDVGGGQGALLARLLARWPGVRGLLFDRPEVVASASLGEVAERCAVVGGSFFDGIPPGGDLVVLRAVLHNWPDEAAVRILRAAGAALAPGGRIAVVERLLDGPGGDAWMDLNMFVIHGAGERSRAAFDALFDAAGLRLVEALPLRGGDVALVCAPASEPACP